MDDTSFLEKIDKIKIHFIIGPGRSGTTLMILVLNENKHCLATPEIDHFIYFYKKYKNVKVVSQTLIDDFVKYCDLFIQFRGKMYKERPNLSLFTDLPIGTKINYSQVTKLIYLLLFSPWKNPTDVRVIVDKNPIYAHHIDKITTVFPDAKLMYLVRDYRAFVCSSMADKQNNILFKSMYNYALVWKLYIEKDLATKQKLGEKMMEVSYEKLTQNPTQIIEAISNHFDLTYHPEMLDFHKTIKHLSSNNMRTNKVQKLSQPINTSRNETWKSILTTSQIEKIEFIASKMGNLFGYTPVIHKISRVKKMYHTIWTLPAYFRVHLLIFLKSPKIHHYLHVKRKIKYHRQIQKRTFFK